ncbi:hypothetical protein [Saccharothrix stipae]
MNPKARHRRPGVAAAVLLLLTTLLAALLAPPASAAPGTARMTSFDPRVHGFQFANQFQTTPFQNVGLPDWRFGGLCGGMSYAALDHFFTGKRPPRQDTLPATGSPLYNYIYQRQETSLKDNADKWLELIANPFGWRTTEFFNWGLQGFNGGRLEELRREIDAGRPAPLGLFKNGNGGLQPHHQVVAIGYDMGRYTGDLGAFKEDLKIFVYDPNFPNEVITMVPRPATTSYQYLEHPEKTWQTYFVDRRYRAATPPAFPDVVPPSGDRTTQLQLHVRTGGDDLRGGQDNVNATVHFRSHDPVVIPNINRSARWINHYDQVVLLQLPMAYPIGDVTGVTLTTTFGGGLGGDNWNVDRLAVRPAGTSTTLYEASGTPLVRFTGENRPFTARVDKVLDGGFEGQPTRGLSAPWRAEGPDPKGVDINLGLQQSGRKNGFLWSAGRTWNAITQVVPVQPHRVHVLRGWVRTSGNVTGGFFGVRAGTGAAPHTERHFTAANHVQYRLVEIPFNPGPNGEMTVFVGYWGPGGESWVQVDAISVLPA